MTFNAYETSIEAGRPIRLYEFRLGAIAWRVANADRVVTYSFAEYQPLAISDDGRRDTGQGSADEFTIRVPHDFDVARLFRAAPPATEIRVRVREMHYGDDEARVYFVGYVRSMRRRSPETAELACLSDIASLDRPGLRLGWSRNCTHTLYDEGCTVDPTGYMDPEVVTAMTGATVTAAGWAVGDGFFAGGYVEWDIGSGEKDRRGVEQHVGGVLTLIGGTSGIAVGMTLTAYPGCPKTIDVCQSRFLNHLNFGGFTSIPGKSPFDGDPVF